MLLGCGWVAGQVTEGCYKFNVCIVFYTLRGDMRGTRMDAKACYEFSVPIVFYTPRGDMRGAGWMPRAAANSTFALFLKASRRHQGTTMHAKGCYELNVCIVFYTLRGDMRVPGWIPRDATNSTFALCFTGIEAT